MRAWTPAVSWTASQRGLARCSSPRALPIVASVAIRSSAASPAPVYMSHTAICTERGGGSGLARGTAGRAGAPGRWPWPASDWPAGELARPGFPAAGVFPAAGWTGAGRPAGALPLAAWLPARCFALAMAAPGVRVGGGRRGRGPRRGKELEIKRHVS
jgi:hypothetical protein